MGQEKKKELKIVIKTYDTVFDVVINIHAKGMVYDADNPQEFIYKIVEGCNYAGIAPANAKKLIVEKYNAENSIISDIVDSVYQQQAKEFATKSLMYNLKVRNNYDEDDWLKLPYIPDEVFLELPLILQKAISVFHDKRERDVFFTGALVVLSGLFPHVHGIYMGRTVYSNLYCFIVAPPASGKGSMLFAKEFGMPYHRNLSYGNENEMILYIPTNISTASLYQQLKDNGGRGILFETEADTMTASFKQEWGGYSDILRKAFQHESISLKRKDVEKGKGKSIPSFIEIDTPKLSVALSGTRSQVRGIVHNTEDGLFSRFIFYTFRSEPVWNKEINNDLSLNDFFKDLSSEIPEIVCNLHSIEKFNFTEEQWQIFHERFSAWQKEFDLFFREESLSIVRRMGLITFRIAMILTLIRSGSMKETQDTLIYCIDTDFHSAFLLIETYIQHSLYAFVLMDNSNNRDNVVDRKLQMFFDSLPIDEINRATAVYLGKKMVNLEERTVDKYLKKLLTAGYLIQDNYGKYKKKN